MRVCIAQSTLELSLWLSLQTVGLHLESEHTWVSTKLCKTAVILKIISFWLTTDQFPSLDFSFLKYKMGDWRRINDPLKDFINVLTGMKPIFRAHYPLPPLIKNYKVMWYLSAVLVIFLLTHTNTSAFSFDHWGWKACKLQLLIFLVSWILVKLCQLVTYIAN